MSKRLFDQHAFEVEQEHEERRRYVLQNASLMDLEALAQGFFERFGLTKKSAAHDALHSSLIATGQEHLANEIKVRVDILPDCGLHSGDATQN